MWFFFFLYSLFECWNRAGGLDLAGLEWFGLVHVEGDMGGRRMENGFAFTQSTRDYGGRRAQLANTTILQISLGDQSNYYLSTARNELGVIMATSEKGNTMVPISWKEFRDTVTGEKESRKVAKPF